MSGLSRAMCTPQPSGIISASGGGGRKSGNLVSPHDTPANSRMNPLLSQFFSKLDSCGSNATTAERVSVFSPPVNGKIGPIPGTPSPSTAMRNLQLNSAHLSDQRQGINEDKFCTPSCSQDSSEYNFNLRPESLTSSSSPLDAWNAVKSSNMGYQYKRDPRRVIVHPYSPND